MDTTKKIINMNTGLAKVIVEETEDPAVQDAIDGCPVGVIEAE